MTAARSSRRLHRWLVGSLTVTLAFMLAPAGTARAADGVPVPPNTGLTNRGAGAVSAADRDFIIKVRLAGLWEVPAGNMAQTMSKDERVKEIGKSISLQHTVLDKLDIAVAKQLGISLPNEPNGAQEGWLKEMENAPTSQQFDQIYIDRLRAAHGNIFPAIATIRASTRNDSVRKLAQETNQFVMTHMTLLESSGLVDYGSLPTAPPPAAAGGPVPVDNQMLVAASGSGVPGVNTSVILLVLAGALVAGVVTTMRIFRTR
jgi:putative membrane protein